jgi:hypothetical protein
MAMGLFSRSTDSDTLVEPRTSHGGGDGDHERFSHYVAKGKIVESAVTGKAVKALCGKKWIPSRDPEKYPICPACKEIHDGLREAPEDK